MSNFAPNDSNPTLSPEEVAKVHALAAERRQRREKERQAKALSDQNFAKREAERRLLASLENSEDETTPAATAARLKAAEKAKADIAARSREVEVARIAAAQAAQAAIVTAERERAVALARVATRAAKLNVPFDLDAALKGRVSAKAAYEAVMNAAADADDADVISTSCGPSASDIAHHDRAGNSSVTADAGWNHAIARSAAKHGYGNRLGGSEPEGDANHFYSQSRPPEKEFGS